MDKKYVLITGATGFIGSYVAQRLLTKEDYGIVAIVRKSSGYKNVDWLKKNGVILYEGNFYDEKLVNHIFEKLFIKFIIHCAALRGAGLGKPQDYYKVNVEGTKTLLDTAFKYGVDKFIFLSTVGVFGTIPKELPARLTTSSSGDNLYHNSKILAEKMVQESIKDGLNAFIIRPTIVYGKGDIGFPQTLVKLCKKRLLFLPKQDNRIHLLEVGKLAELIMQLIETNTSKRTFIVADKYPVNLRELADLIHFHYYHSNYPLCMSLPDFAFRLLRKIFCLINNEKWLTRLSLITKSWYFDISETIEAVNYNPLKTKDNFIKCMDL
ncbi:MAG: NAD-dependent epimerase/dehydratase family protein [Actinomycetota bacterium]